MIPFATEGYPENRDSRPMELSADARTEYARLYRGELSGLADGEKVAALIERRAPMLLRLAMIFALTDRTLTIELPHIHAALTVGAVTSAATCARASAWSPSRAASSRRTADTGRRWWTSRNAARAFRRMPINSRAANARRASLSWKQTARPVGERRFGGVAFTTRRSPPIRWPTPSTRHPESQGSSEW